MLVGGGILFILHAGLRQPFPEQRKFIFLLAHTMALLYVLAYPAGAREAQDLVYVYSRSQSFRMRRY